MTQGLSRQNPSAEPPGDQEGHGEEELLWGRQRNAKPVPSHPVLVTWNPGRRAVATWGGGSEGTRGRCQYYTTSKAHSVNLSYSPSPFPPLKNKVLWPMFTNVKQRAILDSVFLSRVELTTARISQLELYKQLPLGPAESTHLYLNMPLGVTCLLSPWPPIFKFSFLSLADKFENPTFPTEGVGLIEWQQSPVSLLPSWNPTGQFLFHRNGIKNTAEENKSL